MAATIPTATATPHEATAQRERAQTPAAPANAAAAAVAGPIQGHAVRVLDPRTEYSFANQRLTQADVEAVARQFDKLTLVDVSGATIDGKPCTDPIAIHRLFPHHERLTVKGALSNTLSHISSQMSPVDQAQYIGFMAAAEIAFAKHFTDLNVAGSVQAMTEFWVDHAGEALHAFLRALPYLVKAIDIQSKYPHLNTGTNPLAVGDLSPEAIIKLKSSLKNEREDIEKALDWALSNIDMPPIVDALQKIASKTMQPAVAAMKQNPSVVIMTLLDAYVKDGTTTLQEAIEATFKKDYRL